jgi:hypothetical protein
MPASRQYQKFLLDVVTACDKSSSAASRRDFLQSYDAWFPATYPDDQSQERGYYSEVCAWWQVKSEVIQKEEPDEKFGFQVIILRRKLRVIWALANAGGMDKARLFVDRINVWLYRYHSGPLDKRKEEWRNRLWTAAEHLESALPKLKICENPGCKTRYFIREAETKYCGTECALQVQEVRRLERRRTGQPLRELSAEARQNIAHAQKERWKKFRAAKRRLII